MTCVILCARTGCWSELRARGLRFDSQRLDGWARKGAAVPGLALAHRVPRAPQHNHGRAVCTSVLRSDREPVHTRQGPLRCGWDLVFVGKLARHCCQQHGRGASEVTTHSYHYFGPSSATSSLANLHLRPALRRFEGRVRVAAAASMHWFLFPLELAYLPPFHPFHTLSPTCGSIRHTQPHRQQTRGQLPAAP